MLQTSTKISGISALLFLYGCGVWHVAGHPFDHKCHRNLKELWTGESCQKPEAPVEASQVSQVSSDPGVCTTGMNNTLCLLQLQEDSIWASKELGYDTVLDNRVSFRSFYRLYEESQQWEHYLFVNLPYYSKVLYEKRSGDFIIRQGLDGYITMYLKDTSCGEQDSLFAIYDLGSKDAFIGRNDNKVDMLIPANVTAAYGVDASVWIEHIFGAIYTWFFDLILAPFSPEFWQALITGAYFYDEDTISQFNALMANAQESCISEEQLILIQDELDIDEDTKAIIESLSLH